MSTELVELAPRAAPRDEVLEAAPVAAFRVLDERRVPKELQCAPQPVGVMHSAAIALAWVFGRAVGFVQLVAGFLLMLAMILSLLAAGLYLLFGSITGIHRWELFAFWLGAAFAAFCVNFALTQVSVWANGLAGVIQRRRR